MQHRGQHPGSGRQACLAAEQAHRQRRFGALHAVGHDADAGALVQRLAQRQHQFRPAPAGIDDRGGEAGAEALQQRGEQRPLAAVEHDAQGNALRPFAELAQHLEAAVMRDQHDAALAAVHGAAHLVRHLDPQPQLPRAPAQDQQAVQGTGGEAVEMAQALGQIRLAPQHTAQVGA